MEILDKYYIMFDEYPYLIQTFSYQGEIYQYLMKKAITERKPLTKEDIEEYLEKNNIQYDVV